MRLSLLPAVLLTLVLPAQAGADAALQRVFDLTRVQLNCEQVAPLLQQGMNAEQQNALGAAFAAGPFCEDLLERTSARLEPGQSEAAVKLLESPLVEHFAAAERAVGFDGDLVTYAQQLKERPPLGQRIDLVRRLDKAAYFSELLALLHYEAGKTRALVSLRATGGDLDEKALTEQSAGQLPQLQTSSLAFVEPVMLYAYRRTPSDQLAEYAALYEQPALHAVRRAIIEALPEVFAARRAQLK